jgi:Tfp pilus assembly protein PilZ
MRQERRRHERTKPPREWAIRCTSADAGFEKYNFASSIIDVSPRGICVVTVGRLRMGTPVTIELYVPDGGSRFKSRALVAWSTTVESKGRVAHVAGLHLDRALMAETRKKPDARVSSASPSPSSTPKAAKNPAALSESDPQRHHPRFAPEEVELLCFPEGLLRALGLAKNAGRRLKDLSRAGAQIICSQKLDPGQRVTLRLEFKKEKMTIDAQGEVRWCRRDTTSLEPRYFAGVLFGDLPPGSEKSLRAIERAFIGF